MDLIELGTIIKNVRLTKGIQQEELSSAVNISRATLSRLENGRVPEIGIRKIMDICERLGLELTLQKVNVRGRPTLRHLAQENQQVRGKTSEPYRILAMSTRPGSSPLLVGRNYPQSSMIDLSHATPQRVRRARAKKEESK